MRWGHTTLSDSGLTQNPAKPLAVTVCWGEPRAPSANAARATPITARIAEPVLGPPCAGRYLTLAMMTTATKPMHNAGSPASAGRQLRASVGSSSPAT